MYWVRIVCWPSGIILGVNFLECTIKELLEYDLFEEVEPDRYYDEHGLFVWDKQKTQEKNCIDKAIKKVELLLKLRASIDK